MSKITTARQLLEALQPYGPVAREGKLSFRTAPPAELLQLLRILHTGVRAAITGAKWWAFSMKPQFTILSPDDRIPADVRSLCVEGDGSSGRKLDRIFPTARDDHPELFSGLAPAASLSADRVSPSKPRTASPFAAKSRRGLLIVTDDGEVCGECEARVFEPALVGDGCTHHNCPYQRIEEKRRAA